MREEINQKCSGLILGLNKSDPCYEAKKQWYQNKKEEDLDSIKSLQARLKKWEKKKFHDIDAKTEETVNSNRAKIISAFNCQKSTSIKFFVVNKITMQS